MLLYFVLFLIALIVIVVTISIKATFIFLPYVSGLMSAILLSLLFPGLKNLIPGEGRLSLFMLILAIETGIGIFTNNVQTSAPTVFFTSMLMIGLVMIVITSSMKIASWQKASAITIIYAFSAAIILLANYAHTGVAAAVARSGPASILCACLYAMTMGINLFVVLGSIWGRYLKSCFSASVYQIFDIFGTTVILAAMVITALISFTRDQHTKADYLKHA